MQQTLTIEGTVGTLTGKCVDLAGHESSDTHSDLDGGNVQSFRIHKGGKTTR